MAAPKCSDEEFIRVWKSVGGSSMRVAQVLGVAPSNAGIRRRRIERRYGIELQTDDTHNRPAYQTAPSCESRQSVNVADGIVLIGSDAHYWPGDPTAAHQAFVKLCRKLKPVGVVLNGDIFDGARISRHERIGWEVLPDVMAELKAVQARLCEIERAAPNAWKKRTRGNHCLRFEKYLGMHAPEFKEVAGFRLRDHIPAWEESWSVWVNDLIIKHRYHNGIHGAYNNALKGGKSIATGHLHSLKVTPWTDYNGTRYGIDTGTLADPWGPQYEYLEDGARNWRAGFAVVTFKGGKLLPPELCEVMDGTAYFRGAAV